MTTSDSTPTPADVGLVTGRQGAVTVLRLNRPEARNALTPALTAALGSALLAADDDPEIRAVVLTGTGDRAFCAGMDLRAFSGGEKIDSADDPGIAGFVLAIGYAGAAAAVWTCIVPALLARKSRMLSGGRDGFMAPGGQLAIMLVLGFGALTIIFHFLGLASMLPVAELKGK